MKNKNLITSILLSFFITTSFTQNTTFQQGFNTGKFSECIKKCEEVLKNNSENPNALFFKGISLVETKKYESAITYLNKAKNAKYQPSFFIQNNLLRANAGLQKTQYVINTLKIMAENGFGFTAIFNNEEFTYLNTNEDFLKLKSKIDANANPCLYGNQYKKLDFWIGEWDVYVRGNKSAISSVTKSKGGCTLHEDYKNSTGFYGRSMSYYNTKDSLYTQIWVNKANKKTVYKEIVSKKGYLQMQSKSDGNNLTRMSYTYDETNDEVSQLMEDSSDKGKNWNQTFLGVYKRKDSKSEIINLIDTLDKALINRNYEVLNKYYSDNLKLIAPNGFVLTKDMALTPFKDSNKKSALSKVENEDVQIRISKSHAIAIMKTIHSFNNGSKDKVYRSIYLYTKEDNIWKLELISSISL